VLTVFASASFALVLLSAGLAYELWTNAPRWTRGAHSFALGPGAIIAATTGVLTFSLTAEIFWEGLKAGLVTFGGAFTVIPYLHDAAVDGQGWLTDGEFVDGLAMSGVLPAPLIIFSTFVGYLAGGLGGALVMTLGIFLPAFVLPIFFHRGLVGIAENPRIRPPLLGVAAAVIGLIAAVTVDIGDASVVDVPTAILAVAAFLAAFPRGHPLGSRRRDCGLSPTTRRALEATRPTRLRIPPPPCYQPDSQCASAALMGKRNSGWCCVGVPLLVPCVCLGVERSSLPRFAERRRVT
jgi:putative chromate ion transporter